MDRLIRKYSTAGPRYTSYPTVPHWDNCNHNEGTWKKSLINGFWQSGKELSLYIHLPFCERLCTYCGCTTRITKNHAVEEKYIRYILKEWNMYLDTLPAKPIIKEIHLGGGTPTFFSPANLDHLIKGITTGATVADDHEFGFEGHPGNTTEEHLKTLSNLGFTRISLGIQDFDPEVQKAINREQTADDVKRVTALAEKYGFTSINFDLIYGLPKQTSASVWDTIIKTISIGPTRIAFYGYAHVPWMKKAQKAFENFLPTTEQRLKMYTLGKKLLTSNGYYDIGMDHFSLPDDPLYEAYQNGTLHRNFMGYTTQKSNLLVGLGMSSISDSWAAFSQNEKLLTKYYERLDNDELPILRGHQLTPEDLIIRRHILNLMCQYETSWSEEEFLTTGAGFNIDLLEELTSDNLITWTGDGLKVTDLGKPFIRNICMALDSRLWKAKSESRFSQTL